MKRYILTLATAAMALFVSAEVTSMKVDPFQHLTVSSSLNVDCVHCPDSVGHLLINAPDRNQTSWIEANTKGDKLVLKLAIPEDYDGDMKNLPSVTVYTNYLVKVENEGDSTVRVLTSTDVPQFEARIIGNGRLSVRGITADKLKAVIFSGRGIMALNGTARKATYSLTGVGTIEADGVECEEADVRLTGTGTIGVNATKKLTIKGSGAGNVYYRGTPEIKKKFSVGLNVEPIN